LVILAEIAGFIGGFIYWRSPLWGPVAGASMALAGTMIVVYTVTMFTTLPRIRRFLQSPEGQALIEMAKGSPSVMRSAE
jgi:hypothetical protein